MKKDPDYKPTRVTMIQHLIEAQIGLIDKKIVDTLEEEEWHSKWMLTERQYQKFQTYAIKIIRRVFRCNNYKAQNTFNWFYDNFGLKIEG